jgi:hypothetical protein
MTCYNKNVTVGRWCYHWSFARQSYFCSCCIDVDIHPVDRPTLLNNIQLIIALLIGLKYFTSPASCMPAEQRLSFVQSISCVLKGLFDNVMRFRSYRRTPETQNCQLIHCEITIKTATHTGKFIGKTLWPLNTSFASLSLAHAVSSFLFTVHELSYSE